MRKNDLSERLFEYSVRVIKFLRNLNDEPEIRIIKYQLIKSSTSTGANYEESQAGSSRADFNNKVRISLKEMRESSYWIRLLNAILHDNLKNEELEWLLNESEELCKILGSIAQKSRKDK